MSESKMLSLYDAAIILNVHYNTLRRWIQMGKVKAVKMGRAWKISTEEVERLKSDGVAL
jgi:excisionase family DNA binding protein